MFLYTMPLYTSRVSFGTARRLFWKYPVEVAAFAASVLNLAMRTLQQAAQIERWGASFAGLS